MSRCKFCDAPLLWAKTEKGKMIPLDPKPYTGEDPNGLFVLRFGTAVGVPAAVFEDEPRYRFHNCSN